MGSRLGGIGARWDATPRLRRTAIGVCVLLLVLGLAAIRSAAATQPRHQVDIRTVLGPGPATLDATGCPVNATCTVTDTTDPRLGGPLRQTYPTATVLLSEQTVDTSGPVRRSRLVAQVDKQLIVDEVVLCGALDEAFRSRFFGGGIGTGSELPSSSTDNVVIGLTDGCSLLFAITSTPGRDDLYADSRLHDLQQAVADRFNG